MHTAHKKIKRLVRHKRIRAKVSGTAERPRLAVFRSNIALYVQLIDDTTARTLGAADTRSFKGTLTERAEQLGKEIAEQAKKISVTAVVFDRGGFRYQGAIARLADTVRSNGITF